jgi:two-component system, OmpR family, sensor histidine kinase PhoQ
VTRWRVLNSIRGRLTLASLALLPLIFGALAWSLEHAFSISVLENQQRQMTLQTYALMASAELVDDTLWLPELMSDDQLNQISSDSYAIVIDGTAQLNWRSLSAADKPIESQSLPSDLEAGESQFTPLSLNQQDMFVFQYAIEWENDEGKGLPFQFVIYETQTGYKNQLQSYRQTLWLWLGSITLLLLMLQLIILRWGLKPIGKLIHNLSAVRQGNEARLNHVYPNELEAVTKSINQLLEHEEKQRERYRNTLANLAHSIKNPVAVMANALNTAAQNKLASKDVLETLNEQNEHINQIVSYQLTRAVSGAATPFSKALPIGPICDQITSALQKVYGGKHMSLSFDIDETATFRGDKGDLMELIGNLLDNAFKYGRERIAVTAIGDRNRLKLLIEDDGPGLNDEQKQVLIRRGERADTAMAGHGIGLAIVTDIVQSYKGELRLGESLLGGLKVVTSFDWTKDSTEH